jgi:RND family efflux transporter MFP subunit
VTMRYLTPLMTMLAGCMTWTCVHAEAVGCLVEPDRGADVGSQSVGVLERLMVERGDVVSAGQVVARLSAQVERASASVAEARSQAEAEVRQAVAAHDLARRKFERTRDLVKQDFVSDQALDQAEAEARVAEQRVMQAREAQKVSLREYRLSSAQLGQRDVRSPFEGIVVERYRTEGERIEREPVVRVARIDPLRIEAIVPASQFGTVLAGQMATIKTDLVNFSAMTAKVVLVDRVIDPASNSFRVRLTLPNPDRKIPPGMRCKVDFALAAAPVAAKVASTPAPNKADHLNGESPALSKAADHKSLNRPASAPVNAPAPADARVAKTPIVGVLPGVLPSVHLVSARMAPERLLVKQYIASREPKLAMSRQMALPSKSSLDDDRPMFSLR